MSCDRGSYHWEIRGRFRKRVVLANVPSFRFSFRGNIRRNHPFGNHPFVNTQRGHWEIKGRFPKGWFWRTYPRSGFRSGGTSAKTTLLETTLLRTPDLTLHSGEITYINVCFWNYFPDNYISEFSGSNLPKNTLHLFVCDSENHMVELFGIILLKHVISVA